MSMCACAYLLLLIVRVRVCLWIMFPGCVNGCTEKKLPPAGATRYECAKCKFNLCDACVKAHWIPQGPLEMQKLARYNSSSSSNGIIGNGSSKAV